MVPGGDLYPTLIRKNPIKPIRIYLQDGEKDLSNEHGNWYLANLQMLSAFEFANAKADSDKVLGPRYEVRHQLGRRRAFGCSTAARCCPTSSRGSGPTTDVRHPAPDIHALSRPSAHWSVSVWRTDPRLAEIVASMWFGCGKIAYQRDRILPSGQSQLLINLGPPQYRIEPGPPELRVPFVDVWYSGLHQGPIDTEAPHGNALLGVAFTARGTFPGWASAWTASPTASSRSRMRSAMARCACASGC